MPTEVVLAKDFDIYVGSTAGVGGTLINGLDTIEFQTEKKETDIRTKTDNGNDRHSVVNRIRSLKLNGKWLADGSGVRDSGQAAVEVLGDEVGDAAKDEFRLMYPGGGGKYFNASANIDKIGGEKDDPGAWEVSLKVDGPTTDIA